MNQKEYMLAFYDALGDLPHDIKANAMSEYQDYFKTGLEQGKTEEEISSYLGDPVALAYAVKQRAGYFNSAPNPPRRRKKFGVGRLIAMLITLAVIIFTINFSLSFTKRGGPIHIELGLGTQYDVNETKEIDLSGAGRIEINTISADTALINVDSGKVKTKLTGNVRTSNEKAVPTLEVTQSGNVIYISEKRGSISSNLFSNNLNMEISIPKSFDGEIIYKGVSGDFGFSDRKLKNLEINLVSGNIDLTNISLDGDFSIGSVSGDIKASDCKVKLLTAKTVSGNVTLSEFDGAADLKTTSGDIRINALSSKEYELSTISGNVNLSLPSGSGFTLEARTTSGDIRCDFDLRNKDSGKSSLKGTSGIGNVPIDIKTTSGDIRITENK